MCIRDSLYDVHAKATKPSSANFSVSGHIAAMWWELFIASTATPFSFAALANSGNPLFKTTGAKQLLPLTFITDEEIFLISGFPLPLIFPLFKPLTYAGNLNKPWDKDPSLSAFLIRSDKTEAVSSSQPLANKVFLAKSKISSNVRETVLLPLLDIIYN